jgi:hypothetical protein
MHFPKIGAGVNPSQALVKIYRISWRISRRRHRLKTLEIGYLSLNLTGSRAQNRTKKKQVPSRFPVKRPTHKKPYFPLINNPVARPQGMIWIPACASLAESRRAGMTENYLSPSFGARLPAKAARSAAGGSAMSYFSSFGALSPIISVATLFGTSA